MPSSAFILARTCTMTSGATTAFLRAQWIFQSSDLTWSDNTAQAAPSMVVSTSNGCPLIFVVIGQQTMSPDRAL